MGPLPSGESLITKHLQPLEASLYMLLLGHTPQSCFIKNDLLTVERWGFNFRSRALRGASAPCFLPLIRPYCQLHCCSASDSSSGTGTRPPGPLAEADTKLHWGTAGEGCLEGQCAQRHLASAGNGAPLGGSLVSCHGFGPVQWAPARKVPMAYVYADATRLWVVWRGHLSLPMG